MSRAATSSTASIEHVGELVARALRQRRAFRGAKRGQPEKRRARILARERRDAPRLLLRAADVDQRRVDQILLERQLEIVAATS